MQFSTIGDRNSSLRTRVLRVGPFRDERVRVGKRGNAVNAAQLSFAELIF